MMRLWIVGLALALCPWTGAAVWGQEPNKEIPELAVLSHYVGKWDSEVTLKSNPGQPNGAKTTGASVSEWIHDGRFMRQTWSSRASDGLPAMTGTTIMTYDPIKKAYRSWSFASTGQMGESQGTWDSKSRTMTWTMPLEGGEGSTVTKATFPNDGLETWTIVVKDKAGTVMAELSGKNKRQTK